jgi:hypothetical protein
MRFAALSGAYSNNWLRVSISLGAARLDELVGWEEMTVVKRAMRWCVQLCEGSGMTGSSGITTRGAGDDGKVSSV